MKTKTKILITSLVLIAIIVVVSVAIAIVFASIKQSMSSDFKFEYTATKDVYATVTGGVYAGENKKQDINVKFEGETKTGDFSLTDISLTTADRERYMKIELKITSDQPDSINTNLYINSSLGTESNNNISSAELLSFEDENNYETFTEGYILLQQNQTIYLQYTFEVKDITTDASISGNISLNFYHYFYAEDVPSRIVTSTIAAVGHYPQTYVGNELNETLKSASETELVPTGKSYTTDSNGSSTILTEYEYNGKKVAKLDSSKVYNTNYSFSTREIITTGETYFFYVQPIKVNVMEVRDDKNIYITKSLLFSQMFNTSGEGNSAWSSSPLRTFLNGTFLEESGLKDLATEISIENGTASGGYTEQENTSDTLWLPSEIEARKLYMRINKPTDMALATYTYYDYNDNKTGSYWTRSACSSSSVYLVYSDGEVNNQDTDVSSDGVCFAFAM